MDGDYDDNFYFNNPVDYVASLNDPWYLRPARAERHPPGHRQRPLRGLAARATSSRGVLWARGIPHSVDDWGPDGGHDWPYWKKQIDEYIRRLY